MATNLSCRLVAYDTAIIVVPCLVDWAAVGESYQIPIAELSMYPGYFQDPIDIQWGSRKYPG